MVPAVVSLSLAVVLAALALLLTAAARRRSARAEEACDRLAALVARTEAARRERAALVALSRLNPDPPTGAETPVAMPGVPDLLAHDLSARLSEPERPDFRRSDVRRRPHGPRPLRPAPDPLPPARP
ncbi:MAG TPA: hypothetical protein VF594_03465 [Rubricoccaceae bacterium]